MITRVPDKILGKNVEDIADKLYTSLTENRPRAKEFQLEYLIINNNPLTENKVENKKLQVNSRDKFIAAFLQYNQEGKYIIANDYSTNDLASTDGLVDTCTCIPSKLDICYKENGEYSDKYYCIEGGVQDTNDFLSGFKFHRSKIKRFLVKNRLMNVIRTKILSKYPRAESFLKDVLIRSNECINMVTQDPFYIRIEEKTKTT